MAEQVQKTIPEYVDQWQKEAAEDLPAGKKALKTMTEKLHTQGVANFAALVVAPPLPPADTWVNCSGCKKDVPPPKTRHGTQKVGNPKSEIYKCRECHNWGRQADWNQENVARDDGRLG